MLKWMTTRRSVLAGATILPASEIMSCWPYSKAANATLDTGSLLDPSRWDIRYSPGMPAHPSADASGGWHFDFPSPPGSINYVTITINRPIRGPFFADMKVDAKRNVQLPDGRPNQYCHRAACLPSVFPAPGRRFLGKWSDAILQVVVNSVRVCIGGRRGHAECAADT